jgi:protein-S-isoprenylcysteine O-methyltransferase Ste14
MDSDRKPQWLDWLGRHRERLINYYLFVNIAGFIVWQGYGIARSSGLNIIEVSFLLQNLVLAGVVLLRKDPIAIDNDLWHQTVALIAFFSGLAFMGREPSGGPLAQQLSAVILLSSNILGIFSLFHLGRSFGILIACREVRSNGVYSLMRHPMYTSDMLLRVGYVISHFSFFTLTLTVLSSACYIYRALLEERFLAEQPAYRAYMEKVRYRFVPGLF